MQENSTPSPSKESEIDLGIFFNLVGRIFQKLAEFIKTLFIGIYDVVIFILLFLKRSFLWLLLGAIAGLLLGIFVDQKGPAYYSDMVVQANFQSTRLLYNQIDYFNSLIKQNRTKDLTALFTITPGEAASLKSFDISPVNDDLEAARIYRNTFLTYKTSGFNQADSQWSRIIKFDDFKKELKDYNFPFQQIRLYTSNPDVFTKVQQGIVQSMSINETLQNIKNNSVQLLLDEQMMLRRSLNGIDSLRSAYNKRIAEIGTATKDQGDNIIVSDREFRSPEIELYDKEMMIKDEYINSRRRGLEQFDILQVFSGFNPFGTKVSAAKEYYLKYVLRGLLAVLFFILAYELFRYLHQLERKKKSLTA